MLIEFQEEHHYLKYVFADVSDDILWRNLRAQNHDIRKEQFAFDMDIPLITIVEDLPEQFERDFIFERIHYFQRRHENRQMRKEDTPLRDRIVNTATQTRGGNSGLERPAQLALAQELMWRRQNEAERLAHEVERVEKIIQDLRDENKALLQVAEELQQYNSFRKNAIPDINSTQVQNQIQAHTLDIASKRIVKQTEHQEQRKKSRTAPAPAAAIAIDIDLNFDWGENDDANKN